MRLECAHTGTIIAFYPFRFAPAPHTPRVRERSGRLKNGTTGIAVGAGAPVRTAMRTVRVRTPSSTRTVCFRKHSTGGPVRVPFRLIFFHPERDEIVASATEKQFPERPLLGWVRLGCRGGSEGGGVVGGQRERFPSTTFVVRCVFFFSFFLSFRVSFYRANYAMKFHKHKHFIKL